MFVFRPIILQSEENNMSERVKDSPKIRGTAEYKGLSVEEATRLLDTTADGLTETEVSNRIRIFGPNEITGKKSNPLLQFLSRYWGPMPWLLELAMVLSIALHHYLEAGIIFALLTINTVIGYMQAQGSQKALEALKRRLAIKARVLRNGKWAVQDARGIVPGDVISIGLGDIVPADAKTLNGELSMDQSVLTGESLPVNVQQSSVIYSSSIVKRGEAKCLVVNTGSNTYFGKTAELVKIAKPKSHQEQIMLAIVRYMMYLGIAALIVVAIDAVFLKTGIVSILTFAVIFLMGAIPVALPAVLTIVQAVGATELVRKGVLVTRLDSIEDAASIDVLCLDKTGTITQNKLSVTETIPFAMYKQEDVITVSALASEQSGKDAIDAAVLEYSKIARADLSLYQQLSFTPFEPSTKRAEAVISAGTKGSESLRGLHKW